jgi:[acyl-carrier-protein] S-malonyltransferase
MGVALAGAYPSAKKRFEDASKILGYDLLAVCAEGPEEKLMTATVAQPALFTAGYATWEVLSAAGIKPAFMAGHSLGEYTACAAAGAFSFDEGVRLVKARSEAMGKAAASRPGTMLAVLGATAGDLSSWIEQASSKGLVVVANENSPGQVIVSGEVPAIEAVEALAGAASVRAIRLKVSGAFHSPLMQEAAEVMKPVMAGAKMTAPAIPVVGNVSASVITVDQQVRQELEVQLVSPVRWELCVRKMAEQGVDRFVEAGPGKVLCGLIKRIDRKLTALPTGDTKELDETISALKGGV